MTTYYTLPEQPTGPVWDKNGRKWTMHNPSDKNWERFNEEGAVRTVRWPYLLEVHGPVTDKPPVKVGDIVRDVADLENLPSGSIVAEPGDIPFYKSFSGGWLNCYGVSEKAMTSIKPVVLRIGKGVK